MRIAGVGTAFPENYFRQDEVVAALLRHWSSKLPSPEVLTRLLARTGVEGRHFVLPLDAYDDLDTWGKANGAWINSAQQLAQNALNSAVDRAELKLDDLRAIFFVSITGVASPSIEAKLINRMRLPLNIKRIPIFGLGCVAGAAGIARAADYVRGFPEQSAALVAVELCSLTWQRDDLSMANLISSGLFGDGAAAVVVTGDSRPGSGPEIIATRSSFYPETENVMGWDISEKGFRIVLSPNVPDMVYQHLARDVEGFLSEHGLRKRDIASWIMHTGGPKVLEATADALELPEGALDLSWECLKRVGNLSSASVLVVLEEFMNLRHSRKGTYGILAAMGPGFCAELVLLRW